MVERGGLENHCRHCLPGVRIPPPPPVLLQMAAIVLLILLQDRSATAQLQYLRYDPAVRPPGTRYLVHRTPHFTVIFESGNTAEAAEAASILERELAKTQALVGDPRPMRMPVVLNAYNDRSNGYVHTLPFRQEIELPHIRGDLLSAHHTSWMQAVVPHELLHAVQAQAGGRFGVGTMVDWVAPDLARSINLALPSGLNEGAAVYYESQVQAHAGRLNDARFQMKMKAALDALRPWSMVQLFEAPAYTWPRSRHYIGGANFFAWQAARDSGSFYTRMRHRLWRFPLRLTGFELQLATGESVRDLKRSFREGWTEEFAGNLQEASAVPVKISGRRGVMHRHPYWVNDSSLVVYKSGYDVISGLYAVNVATGVSRRLHAVRLPEDAWFSLDDSTALYSRYVRDTFVPTRWVAEVFALDLRTREARRLTREGRVFAPVRAGDSILAVRNSGQHNVISAIMPDGTIKPIQSRQQVTVIQMAPSPKQDIIAVLMRSAGEQGIYRVAASGQELLTPQAWIVLPGVAIREVSWSPDGRFLLYTADLGGTSNVFSYDLERERTTQLTRVRYGAFDPQVSPDGTTLAFVSYDHERHDLVSIPFVPESGPEISLPNDAHIVPVQPIANVPAGFDVEPYSIRGQLSPRLLLPMVHYEYRYPGRKLGFGGGLQVMGSDPLRRVTYTTQAYRQSGRFWGSASVNTMLGLIQTSGYAFRRPRTVTAAVRNNDGSTSSLTYGRNQEHAGLQFRIPLYLESGVRSTLGAVRVGVEAGQESWFSVDENTVPVYAESGESPANRVGFTAMHAGVSFNIRHMRNPRDIWPHRGGGISVSAHSDLWHEKGQTRRAILGHAVLYWSPSRRAHTGLRLGISALTQNRPNVYDAMHVMPRTYEDSYIASGQTVKADLELAQPIWYIDDGFLHVPMYFKALYLYGFAEAIVHSDIPALRTARAAGTGLGLEWRIMHYVDLNMRIGLAYPDAGGFRLTFR